MCITILITYLGVVVILINKISDYEILLLFVLPILYCICLASSSNVGLRSFSNALIISSMGTLIVLGNNVKAFSKLILSFIIVYSLIFKVFGLYNNTVIGKNYAVQSGPLMCLQEYEGYSEDQVDHINKLNRIESFINKNRVIIIGYNNIDYFINNVRIGINAGYQFPNNKDEYLEILETYLDLHNYSEMYILLCENKLNIKLEDFKNYEIDFVNQIDDYLLFKISK